MTTTLDRDKLNTDVELAGLQEDPSYDHPEVEIARVKAKGRWARVKDLLREHGVEERGITPRPEDVGFSQETC